jgi:tRNA threonylcarbamoyladenosine biosynthesis protein TsaE
MSPPLTRSIPDEAGTRALGLALGRLLRSGDVVALQGELGAGKTTLVRAIAEGLGINPEIVSSPTFVIVNEYDNPGAKTGRPDLIHIDAYRLSGTDDLDALGWDRLMNPLSSTTPTPPNRAAVVIEWPERIAAALPGRDRLARIHIQATGESARRFELHIPEPWLSRPGIESLGEPGTVRCRVTGRLVPPDSPTFPFADEKAKRADLYKWLTGSYSIGRPIENQDFSDGDPEP